MIKIFLWSLLSIWISFTSPPNVFMRKVRARSSRLSTNSSALLPYKKKMFSILRPPDRDIIAMYLLVNPAALAVTICPLKELQRGQVHGFCFLCLLCANINLSAKIFSNSESPLWYTTKKPPESPRSGRQVRVSQTLTLYASISYKISYPAGDPFF